MVLQQGALSAVSQLRRTKASMGRQPAFPERPDDWYARRDHSIVGRAVLLPRSNVCIWVCNCVDCALLVVGRRELQKDPGMIPGPHAGILFR